MPLVPVAIAIGTVALSAGSIGAVIGGSLAIGSLAATVASVGAVVGAIGAVTHNKALSTAGMVLGAVGGVTSLANAAGVFGEGATVGSLFGSTGEAAGGGDFIGASGAADTTSWTGAGAGWTDTTGAAGAIGSGEVASASFDEPTMDVVSNAVAQAGGTPVSSSINVLDNDAGIPGLKGQTAATGGGGGGTSIDPAVTAGAARDAGVASTTDAAPPPPPPQSLINSLNPDDIAAKGVTDAALSTSLTPTPPAGGGGLFGPDGLLGKDSFLRSNGGGMIGMGIMQASGSLLSGMTDSLKPAEIANYEANARANNATASITEQQSQNMKGPIPVARRVSVTGRPGLINSGLAAGAAGGAA